MASEALNTVLQTGQLATGILHHSAALRTAHAHHEQEVEQAQKLHEKELTSAQLMHKYELKHAREVHEVEMKKARDYHQREVLLSKQAQLMSHYSELERHFVQLDADLVNASKESERDMYDQRNQQLNTLIVSSSVMIAASVTLLIEGGPTISTDVDDTTLFFFALTCSLSFALQTVCVVLCIETLRLGSGFMIRRARKMNTELEKNRMKVEKAFDNLRMPMSDAEVSALNVEEAFVPTAALTSGLYNSTSAGNLGGMGDDPDRLSPKGGGEMEMMNHEDELESASLNNPPVGTSAMEELPPTPALHPDCILEERKEEGSIPSEVGAAGGEHHGRGVSFQETPPSNLTSPSHSQFNSASPSPKHLHQDLDTDRGRNLRMQIPPIITEGSNNSNNNWVIHGHGRYEGANTPYIGASSKPSPGSGSSSLRNRGGGNGSVASGWGSSSRKKQEDSNSFEKDRDRIEVQWQNIEVRTHKLMRDRYAVNNAFTHKYSSFETFWAKYCSSSHQMAGLTFYCGTAIMLIGIIIWGSSQFYENFKSYSGAIAVTIPIALSIPLSLFYKFNLHQKEIAADNEWKEREQREEAEKYLERNGRTNPEMYRPSFPKVASSATKASPMNRFNTASSNDAANTYAFQAPPRI